MDQQPITLKEYVNKLPAGHPVRVEYSFLKDHEDRPLAWFFSRLWRKFKEAVKLNGI